MIHPVYHLTLMQTLHHLQQLAEELLETFPQIFHQAQEVVDHGGVVVEDVVEGVENKVETVSYKWQLCLLIDHM